MLRTTIKSGAIKLYLAETSSISLNVRQLDPLLNECDQDNQLIKIVLSEVKR